MAPVASADAAEFGIAPDGFAVRLLDATGSPESRAGAHPDRLQIEFELEGEGSGASPRDLIVQLPPGFGGDPGAVPECPRQAYEEGEECPPETQVGSIVFGAGGPGSTLPVFQLQPEDGQVAAFASKQGVDIPFEMELRSSDLGISLKAAELSEGAPSEAHIELWGVPADHQEGGPWPRRAFLTAPSSCGEIPFVLRTRSHQVDAPWLQATATAGPLTGCESLAFDPRLALRLSNPVADSPTGAQIELTMPPDADPDGLASAQLKDVSIALPPGLTVSPGGAAGLAVCTDAQLGAGDDEEEHCPPAAAIGAIEVASAALGEPISGTVYLGEERDGERFRLFVVARGPGLLLKLAGALHPDPATGRLAATLHDLPQATIDRLAISFDGGPDGLLASPLACGTAIATASFAPHGGGASVQSEVSMPISAALPGAACPGPLPFAPQLTTAAASSRAAKPTSLSTSLRRRAGEALPRRFSLTLPAGMSAALGSVDTCPQAAASAAACPPASRVGNARATIGSGPQPAELRGAAYLAGAYRRAPYSLVMAFGAAIGPFDLGTIVLRARAEVNGRTGRVTITTDDLPEVVEGVPVRFQAIELALDRPGLLRNPTSCKPASVDARIEAQGGELASAASQLPLRGCRRLPFEPRIGVRFAGRGPLRENGEIGLRVAARMRTGDANLRAIEVSLPRAVQFELGGLGEICSRRDALSGLCPDGSRVGSARARTLLQATPLVGSVYVVQPQGGGQPDLWVRLAASGFQLSFRAASTVEKGRFATQLAGLPDMPLSSFTMRLGLRDRSFLSLAEPPCLDGDPRRFAAEVTARGQNGAERHSRVRIGTRARCR